MSAAKLAAQKVIDYCDSSHLYHARDLADHVLQRIAQLETASLNQRRQIHNLERHNQHFERCESSWCNPSEDPTELSKTTPGDRAKLETIAELEAENAKWKELYSAAGRAIDALESAGFGNDGKPNTLLAMVQEALAENAELRKDKERLEAKLNTPELHDFASGIVSEAQHQRHRWTAEHDGGKAPADWFWLVGYLAGKALTAHIANDQEKALHHTISTAAALANWHASILGASTEMRPGIATPLEAKCD